MSQAPKVGGERPTQAVKSNAKLRLGEASGRSPGYANRFDAHEECIDGSRHVATDTVGACSARLPKPRAQKPRRPIHRLIRPASFGSVLHPWSGVA